MDNSKPVESSAEGTVRVRQGTGPRASVPVLMISTVFGPYRRRHPAGILFARSGT